MKKILIVTGLVLITVQGFAEDRNTYYTADQFTPDTNHFSTSSSPAAQDTTRYTLLPSGIPGGERLVWFEKANFRQA